MNKITTFYTENEELVAQINTVLDHLSHIDDEGKMLYYPIGFFVVFVKFQKCIHLMFENYCLGEKSTKNFLPNRKHIFQDNAEFTAFLGSKNKDYIDFDDKILSLSKYIFDPNPFDNLSSLSPLSYQQLIIVRNFIAHESNSSQQKMLQTTHNMAIGDYFAKKKDGKLNFDKTLLSLKQFSDYIIDGREE